MTTAAILGLLGVAIAACLIRWKGISNGRRKQRLEDAKKRLDEGIEKANAHREAVEAASQAHKRAKEGEQALREQHAEENAQKDAMDADTSKSRMDDELGR